MTETRQRPRWEVAEVFRRFGDDYRQQHHVPLDERRVMKHIEECRTAALGGHLEECDLCGHEHPVYNSCRDRHCPKCQTITKERWLEARKAELLPVDYFHNVFTVPHELNFLVLANKRLALNLLFKAVSETLVSFGHDPRSRLGGTVGFTLILHTWNQQLLDHFHLHCVIPAGALSDDGKNWIRSRNSGFLFSVKALGVVFRSKYLSLLREAFDTDKLKFPGALADLAIPQRFDMLVESLSAKEWVVYSKAPFGGPERVLNYLGRYTHRVAISNHRLVDVTDEAVSFSYRDRTDGNKTKMATVGGQEFIRRFLLHTLPLGFVRIRHYGFLASRAKRDLLGRCRQALTVDAPPVIERKTPEQMLLERTGIDILRCPHCGRGRMVKVRQIRKPKTRRVQPVMEVNTS